jgi:hypothetical protein
LELNASKTLITHSRTRATRFLVALTTSLAHLLSLLPASEGGLLDQ